MLQAVALWPLHNHCNDCVRVILLGGLRLVLVAGFGLCVCCSLMPWSTLACWP